MKGLSSLQYTQPVKQHLHDIKGPHISVQNFCIPQLDFVTILSQQGRIILPPCAATLKSWVSSKELKSLPQLFPELALI